MKSVRSSTSVRKLRVAALAVAGLVGLGAGVAFAASGEIDLVAEAPLAVAEQQARDVASVSAPIVSRGSEIDRAWFGSANDLDARAQSVARRALELGAGDVEHAARALISPQAPGNPMRNTRLATRLAPSLPIVHVAEARALWDDGRRSEAAKSLIRGASALPHHLEGSLWFAASLLTMLVGVALIASFGFIAALASTVFSHASHDVGDLISKRMPSFASGALLSLFLLIPVVLGLGLLGFVLALFALGFAYGNRSHRVSLAFAAVLTVIVLFPLARVAGVALGALGSDPIADATHAVVQGTETKADVELLEVAAEGDLLAEQVLAMRARRSGDLEDAERRYSALLEDRVDDPVVTTNLANLYFRRGESEAAINLYEEVATRMDSPIVLFNLSQAYASAFRMEDFESTMRVAQQMSPELAQNMSRAGDATFVADLPLPVKAIRERMVAAAQGDAVQRALVARVAPGWLGSSWWMTAAAFALVSLLSGFAGSRFDHSSQCNRCGRRICGRCDGTYWNSEICDPCHHLYHQPETTDPTLRTERLAVLRRRELRLDKLVLGVSLLVPGAAGFFAKRPDQAFLGMLLFLLAAAMFVWRAGVVPDPLAVGALGPLLFTIAAATALLAYSVVLLSSILIRRSH